MSLLDNKQSNDAKRYKARKEELTYGQLKAGSWFVRHKTHVQNVGIGMLLLFAVITVSYSSIVWIGYGAIGAITDAENRAILSESFENYTVLQPSYSAAQVVFGDTEVLSEGNDIYHIVNSVRNPNPNWIVEITYQYTGNFGQTGELTTTLMPGARSALSALGVESANGIRNVKLDVLSFDWGRIDPHLVSDPVPFVASRTRFTTSDTVINRPDRANDVPGSIQFVVQNDTAYNYVSVPFTVLMYSGDTLVQVRPLVIDRFLSGATDPVTFNLGFESLSISEVEVLSELNIFENASYLSVEER